MRSIIFCENQELMSFALTRLGERSGLFSVFRKCVSSKKLLTDISLESEPVVVVDFLGFDVSTDYLSIIGDRFPKVSWLLMSNTTDDEGMVRLIKRNKSFGFILTNASVNETEEALRWACSDRQYLCEEMKAMLSDMRRGCGQKEDSLTPTEREILKLIALGKSTKAIAAERFLSVLTVATHRKNIFRKLNVSNAHDAVKFALRVGIVQPAEYYI